MQARETLELQNQEAVSRRDPSTRIRNYNARGKSASTRGSQEMENRHSLDKSGKASYLSGVGEDE